MAPAPAYTTIVNEVSIKKGGRLRPPVRFSLAWHGLMGGSRPLPPTPPAEPCSTHLETALSRLVFTLAIGVSLAAPGLARADAPAPLSREGGLLPEGARNWSHVCSLRHRLCVRAAPETPPTLQLATVAAADRAWDVLTGVLGVPAPEGPFGDPWEIYLLDNVEGGERSLPGPPDPVSRFDRAASFALVDRATTPGCSLDLALARAVARGSLWRAAPATAEGSSVAQEEALARIATPCLAPGDDDLLAFQSQPERCVVDAPSNSFDRGASRFFDWVDARFGARPGLLLLGTWALAPTQTPPHAWQWAGSPTGFDVLRVSLKGALWPNSSFDDILVQFAVARASMSPPPRIAWRLPWPKVARRIAAPEPVAPTGASYVLIDHGSAPAGARLRLEAEWEDFGRMRWVVAKLDASGRALAEIPIVSLDRGTHASMTIDGLDGVDRVLVVAENVGSTDHAFDPHQGEWEPHGWLLTLEGQ